jgi:hypothetical protein
MSRVRSVPLSLILTILAGCDGPTPITAPSPGPASRTVTPALAVAVLNTDDAGPGSLRQAIDDALGGETIVFDPSIAGQTIVLTTGQIVVPVPLTIQGPPSGITISGNGASRVLRIRANDIVLRNLTITGGKTDEPGGGIMNNGTLTIEHSTISGNESSGSGTVPSVGGGVYNDYFSVLTLVNSTVSGNRASSSGGGIFGDGPVTLINSTVARNDAPVGGGIATGAALTLRNALLAGNTASTSGPNCVVSPAAVVYEGTSLADDASCGSGAAMRVGDAMLGPLASNGGPTQTHALLVGSAAIEAATSCSVTTDQRYVARPQPSGGACDIGAYEFTGFLTAAITIDQSVTVNPRTGVAVVSGTLACGARIAAELQITLVQSQKVGRVSTSITSAAPITVDCFGTTYWSVALAPASGGFQTGTAVASVSTTKLDMWYLPSSATSTVKLFWGRK